MPPQTPTTSMIIASTTGSALIAETSALPASVNSTMVSAPEISPEIYAALGIVIGTAIIISVIVVSYHFWEFLRDKKKAAKEREQEELIQLKAASLAERLGTLKTDTSPVNPPRMALTTLPRRNSPTVTSLSQMTLLTQRVETPSTIQTPTHSMSNCTSTTTLNGVHDHHLSETCPVPPMPITTPFQRLSYAKNESSIPAIPHFTDANEVHYTINENTTTPPQTTPTGTLSREMLREFNARAAFGHGRQASVAGEMDPLMGAELNAEAWNEKEGIVEESKPGSAL